MGRSKEINQYVFKKVKVLMSDESRQRARLARLRRGVGKNPAEVPQVWELLFEDLPEGLEWHGETPSYAEWAIHNAMTLFALHQQGKSEPMNKQGVSFGSAVSRLIDPARDNQGAVKRRFDAVITTRDIAELSHHARGLIQMMKAKDIGLDYPQFAEDMFMLQFSPESRRGVCLKWGRDFYRIEKTDKKPSQNNEEQGE